MNFEESQHQLNFKRYIGGLIQLKLILQQNFVKFSRSLQVLIIFFSSMQSAIFIIRPIFNNISLQRGQTDFLRWVMYLARFDLFIIDQLPGIVYHYYFILVLVLLVIFEIIIPNALTIYQMYQKKLNRQYLDIQLHNQSIFISFLLQCYSIYAQLFNIYLKVPFYILMVHQINTAYLNNELGYLVIGLIVHFLLILTHLFQISLLQESDSLEVSGFQTLNFSFSDVVIELLIITQLVIYATMKNPINASNIQAVLIIAISMLQLIQVIVLKKLPINAHNYTILITQSIILTYTICWLTYYTNLMCIIAIPLIYILIQQYEYQKLRLITNVDLVTEIRGIRFFMAQFVNEQFISVPTIMIIQSSIFLGKHKQQCQELECYCQKQIEVEDPKQIQFLKNQQFVDIYLMRMKSIYSQKMDANQRFNLSYTDILQYAQLLNFFGQSLKALQNCTYALQNCTLLIENIQEVQPFNDNYQDSQIQTHRALNTVQQSEYNQIITNKQNIFQKHQIKQRTSMSWLLHQKFQILIYRIQQKLNRNLSYQSELRQQSISNYMQRFLIYEQKNQEIQNSIISIIQQKVKLYDLLCTTVFHTNKMFKTLKQIGQKALNLELMICKQYDLFPSVKYQSIICFFQAEIMNNIFYASSFASLTSMSEDKLMDMQISQTNTSSKNVNYMILSLDEQCSQLNIEKYSNNLHSFFGYEYEFFKEQTNLNFLLPIGIVNQHRSLICNFLQTGKSKYFQDQALSFFKAPNQFIKPCKMMVDIHYNISNCLGFVVFIDQWEQDSDYIFIDSNNVIGGLTSSIFEKIGFTNSEIEQYGTELQQHYKCQIIQVIPDFDTIQQNELNCTLRFIKLNHLRNNTQINTIQSNKSFSLWKNKNNYSMYSGSVQIKSYQSYDIRYSIIQIDNVQSKKDKTHTIFENHLTINSIDEDVRLLKPLGSLVNDLGQSDQLNQIIMQQSSNSAGIIIPQLISSNYQETSRMLNTARSQGQQQFFTNNYCKDSVNSISSQMKIRLEKSYEDVPQNIIDQVKRVQYTKPNINQQFEDLETSASTGIRKSKFFNKYDLIAKSTNKIKMPRSIIVTYFTIVLFAIVSIIFYAIVLTQNIADMRKFIDETQLLQVHSGFMAPLDSYQSFIVQANSYKILYQTGIVITNLTLLGTYNNWLIERIWKGYSDMQNSFVQQFTNRYTIQFYVNNSLNVLFQNIGYKLQQKNMSFQESLHQMLEYQFMMRGQFQALNIPFQLAQLTAYCTQFYAAQGLKNPTQTQLSICFRQVIAQQNGSANLANTPASVYFQANYFDFHNKFQKLSDTILAYSLNRKCSVGQQWIWTWVTFLVISAIVLSISCYSYRLYIKYYERLIDLQRNLNNKSLQQEIKQYNTMIAKLQNDSNILFKYQFNLEFKEEQIEQQKCVQQQVYTQQPLKLQQRRNRQSSNPSLSSTLSFLGFFSFIVIFMIFSIIIYVYNSQYLDQYAKTASFYVTLSDITYILPGLYFQRYLAYTIQQYPYYNQSNINDLYSRIAFGLQTIESFQNFLINYDANLFLSDDYFNTQLTNMNSHGVCDFLPATIKAQVTFYCPQAFQGALTQGYFQSLNYIYHSFENEKSINNFTKQTTYNLFEIEGAYILMRATQVLQSSLFQSISQRTNDSINITQEISVLYLVLMAMIVVFLYYYIVGYYKNEFFIIRRSILLLPTQTLFLDDVFERSLRFISLKDGN